jgi:uncharacterized protein (TIGR02757 family)
MISANKKKLNKNDLRVLLDERVLLYNQPSFIPRDPISIPHLFTRRQDIEIAGLFAAVLAWGNRTTIINKSRELLQRMDMAPHQFCLQHSSGDLKKLLEFKHRTFNDTDLLYFIAFLHQHYQHHNSLETAFIPSKDAYPEISHAAEKRLTHFHRYFFSLEDAPERTRKHIATPERGSACKRLNMFLRWMVRNDNTGVDFGIWQQIAPTELICPLDLHVARVARKLGLLRRKNNDWLAALELTKKLRQLDTNDPVKYDFALFGLGVMEKY